MSDIPEFFAVIEIHKHADLQLAGREVSVELYCLEDPTFVGLAGREVSVELNFIKGMVGVIPVFGTFKEAAEWADGDYQKVIRLGNYHE